jgi:hypothetical protein
MPVAAAVVAAAFGGAVVGAAGAGGLLYLPLYVLALVPGWLVVRAMFSKGAARWIAGAVIGYAATQLALWACIAAGLTEAWWFAAAWLVVTSAAWWAGRLRREPLVALGPWGRSDVAALCLVLLLVPALMGLPYANIGRPDDSGTRYYRAYFTADFVWHTALASELGKYDMPPANPYLASDRLHYYWTYFLLPAVVAESVPDDVPAIGNVQDALKLNALCNALLLASAIFLFARTAVPSAWLSALAVVLVMLAASAEGALVLSEVVSGGRPLDYVKTVNIDAITAWRFDGLRIDGLARSMLYNPQHSLSCALALVALAAAGAAGFGADAGAVLAIGGVLGLSTAANPFLGGVFGLIYGVAMALAALRHGRRSDLLRLGLHGLAALPVVAAILWCQANEMVEGAGTALTLGFGGDAANSPVATVLVSLGPVLLPALAGALPARRLPAMPALIAASGLMVGLLLMHLVRISDGAWVGFRAGQIMQCVMPALVARFLWTVWQRSRAAMAAVAAIVLVIGLPTTAIDIYNAQDISNLRPGPGFPWTLTVTPAQQDAFAWIRERTSDDAVVQMDAIARGRAHWSLIPTFAERRMAAGLPISLLATPRYTRRADQVRDIYRAGTPQEAWRLARSLRIDYLYVDGTERAVHGDSLRKFDAAPALFERAFGNDEVVIYAVRGSPRP